jgi:SagB-type dehydrogenase family enzyme
MARMPKRLAFLCTPLEDPRRIELRQPEILNSYHHRGQSHDVIEIAHGATKMRRIDRSALRESVLTFEQPFMQEMEFTHDREDPLTPLLRLPPPALPDRSFADVLRGRHSVRQFGGAPLDLSQVSALLFGAVGETGRIVVGPGEDDRPVAAPRRTSPSAGALHPTEMLAAILQNGALAAGIYRYDATEHALEPATACAPFEPEKLLSAFPIHPRVVDLCGASAIFFIASKFWRTRAKYGPRAYRYCLQEAGCVSQNLGLTAVALGLGHVVLGGFYDDEVHDHLELDGVDRAVISTVAVGTIAP